MSPEWIDPVVRVAGPAVGALAGFMGGYLTAERRGLRAVEAALYGAAIVAHVAEEAIRLSDSDEEAHVTARAIIGAGSLDIASDILKHLRAVDLPQAVGIDDLANIHVALRTSRNALDVIESGKGGHADLHEILTRQIETLKPTLQVLNDEADRLSAPWWKKVLRSLRFWRWFKKR